VLASVEGNFVTASLPADPTRVAGVNDGVDFEIQLGGGTAARPMPIPSRCSKVRRPACVVFETVVPLTDGRMVGPKSCRSPGTRKVEADIGAKSAGEAGVSGWEVGTMVMSESQKFLQQTQIKGPSVKDEAKYQQQLRSQPTAQAISLTLVWTITASSLSYPGIAVGGTTMADCLDR